MLFGGNLGGVSLGFLVDFLRLDGFFARGYTTKKLQGFAADCSLTAKKPFATDGIAVFSDRAVVSDRSLRICLELPPNPLFSFGFFLWLFLEAFHDIVFESRERVGFWHPERPCWRGSPEAQRCDHRLDLLRVDLYV